MRLVASLACVSLLLVAGGARAQQISAARHREAREHFYNASVLYEQGNLEGAIAEFRASAAIEPLPVVHFDVAQCLRGLYRYAEAIAEYQSYLDESGPELPDDRREAVRQTMLQLQASVAPVTLDVAPDGAEIRIDGRSVGESPLPRPVVLAAGRRTLEVVADGYVTLRDELEVVGRTPRTLRLRLAPVDTAGTLRVRSLPERAAVRIDGLDVGTAPVERSVSAGGHVIEATLPTYEHLRAPVTLGPRQTFDFLARLEHVHDPPFWEQWWFWASVSAAVAVGVILLIALVPEQRNAPVPGATPPGIVSALRAW